MKRAFLNSIVPLLFIGSVVGIYSHQQSLLYQPDEVFQLSGIYIKKSLKKDRQNPLKLFLKNDVNTYVLKKNTYKAWDKHSFLKNVNLGDTLHVGIDKQMYNIINIKGPKKYIVKMITLKSGKTSYLNLEDYNTFQKAGSFKLYIFSALLFIVYLFIRYYKFKSYRIE